MVTNTFTLNNPIRASYSFRGWTGSNGSVPNPVVTIPKGSTGAKSYNANWCRNCAAVSPATCIMNLSSCTYTTTCPNGYIINNNGAYNPSCTIKNYKVKYDANGGTGKPDSQTKRHNIDLKLSTKKPTKANNTFSRWKDTDGTSYNPGGTYTKNKDTTMKAHWCTNCAPTSPATCVLNSSNCTYTTTCPVGYEVVNNGKYNPSCKIKTFTVKYSAGSATNVPASQTKTYGKTLKLSTKVPLLSNYTFSKWKENDGTVYNPGGTYTKEQNTTLTAQWCRNCAPTGGATCTLNVSNCTYTTTCPTGYTISNNGKYNPSCKIKTFTVKYNANGGTNAPANQTKTYGKTLKLSTQKPTKANHTFSKWKDTDGTSYNSGGSYTKNKDTTMTAQWCRSCAPTGGATCVLNSSNCTYTTNCPPGYSIVNNGTYYPSCKKNNYTITITYDNAHISGVTLNGSSTTLSKTVPYGTEVTISATSIDYHRFTRWSDGNTTKTNRKVKVTGNMTISAEGVENVLQIHYKYGNADQVYECGPKPHYCGKGGSKQLLEKKNGAETVIGTQNYKFSTKKIKVYGTNGGGRFLIKNNGSDAKRCWYVREIGGSVKMKDEDDKSVTDSQIKKFLSNLGVSGLITSDQEVSVYPVVKKSATCPTKAIWE